MKKDSAAAAAKTNVERQPIWFERLGAFAIQVIVLSTYLPLLAAIPQYSKAYEGFGTDLPFVTKIVINDYWTLWVVPVVSVVAFLLYLVRVPYTRGIQAACLISVLLVAPIFYISMYLPIWQLNNG